MGGTMLDLKFVRDHLPQVEQAMKDRGLKSPWLTFSSTRASAAVC